MSRVEFMNQLKNLLWDISELEREEAINYYEDYFDDAGADNEAQVIEALGSPEKVAGIIKEGLKEDAAERGEFSEKGFSENTANEKNEVIPAAPNSKKRFFQRVKENGNGTWILILIAAIFALPILGPLALSAASVTLGVLAASAIVLISLCVIGIALIVAGAGMFAATLGILFAAPTAAIVHLGISLLLIGVGILVFLLGIKILTIAIPAIIRFVVKIVKKPFEKKGV